MSNSLFEAFQALETLEEDVFNVTTDGIAKLKEFEDGDSVEEMETIIDPLAETDEDLQASYIGKAILNCIICQSKIYKDPSEITLSEDDSLVNVGEECPYCQSPDGYKVIGQVAEYNPAESEETTDEITDVKIDDEEIEEEPKTREEIVDEEGSYDAMDESIKTKKGVRKARLLKEEREDIVVPETSVRKAVEIITPDEFQLDQVRDDLTIADVWDKMQQGENIYVIASVDGEGFDSDVRETIFNAISEAFHIAYEDVYNTWMGKPINEDFNKVDIETDTSKMTMTSDENGKVTVTTEPIENAVEEVPAETIAPVSTEVEAEIMDAPVEEPEYQDFEIDEFDETEFDSLGEGYLKRVYENVDSYKTTKGSINGNKLKLEGIINFKSGKQAKTNFVFESKTVTKSGKLKLIGENQQFAKGKKSFTLTGKVDGKKLIAEGLTYNYRAKDADGRSKRLYGRIGK